MLKLWTDENDYAIAATAEEARRLTKAEHVTLDVPLPCAPAEDWEPLADDAEFTFVDDGLKRTTQSALAWCKERGAGYFCTADY